MTHFYELCQEERRRWWGNRKWPEEEGILFFGNYYVQYTSEFRAK